MTDEYHCDNQGHNSFYRFTTKPAPDLVTKSGRYGARAAVWVRRVIVRHR